ncbi:MAG: 50S ribosomal protein L25 [Chloroflexia bacterium]|nr:50S ribosomal protein L25 [Chloroflexia bacterium]
MANRTFEAQRRTVLGKKVKRMRREGRVPGIVYGPVVEGTVPVSVDSRDFLKFYQSNGHSTLFDLTWEDGSQSVFIRDVQQDPVRRQPVHVDFFAPNLLMPVRAMVPLVLHNPVQIATGVLTESRTEIEVEALPALIPHQIDVDVSMLQQPGDAIRVGDLTLPAEITAITDADELLVLIEAVYQEPEAEAAEGAEEAEETAAAAESDAAEATEE